MASVCIVCIQIASILYQFSITLNVWESTSRVSWWPGSKLDQKHFIWSLYHSEIYGLYWLFSSHYRINKFKFLTVYGDFENSWGEKNANRFNSSSLNNQTVSDSSFLTKNMITESSGLKKFCQIYTNISIHFFFFSLLRKIKGTTVRLIQSMRKKRRFIKLNRCLHWQRLT